MFTISPACADKSVCVGGGWRGPRPTCQNYLPAQNYMPEELAGRQVVAVMSFPSKRIAGVKSEVLLLGAYSTASNVVLLQLTQPVENGSRVAWHFDRKWEKNFSSNYNNNSKAYNNKT